MTALPVLFVQGAGDMREPDGSGGLAGYLADELGSRYKVLAPAMPDPDNPRYRPWRDRIERELAAVGGDPLLVGHSFGGSVLLKYLAEGSYGGRIRGLFLVAVPHWGAEAWAYEEFAVPDDVASKLGPTPVFLYHSRDDPEVPFGHFSLYAGLIPKASARSLTGSEHSFVRGLPELVDDIRSTAS
jgi:predicted alpha/beta hydrolase family esterase